MRAKINASYAFTLASACAVIALASCGGGSPGGSARSLGSATVQFEGDTGTGNPPTYKDHPDMAIAASGTQIVETTGQDINV